MIFLQLFISFLQIGAFSFGGGYAAMPLIQEQVVTIHHWLTISEFNDLVTLSQMTPGPIAINAATFVGEKTAGFLGAICATVGCILPSCLLVMGIACFYLKYKHLHQLTDSLYYLKGAVIALIASAGITILSSSIFIENKIRIDKIGLFMVCLYLLMKKKMNPILVMLLSGLFYCFYSI